MQYYLKNPAFEPASNYQYDWRNKFLLQALQTHKGNYLFEDHKHRANKFLFCKKRATFWDRSLSAVTFVSQAQNLFFGKELFESAFCHILLRWPLFRIITD